MESNLRIVVKIDIVYRSKHLWMLGTRLENLPFPILFFLLFACKRTCKTSALSAHGAWSFNSNFVDRFKVELPFGSVFAMFASFGRRVCLRVVLFSDLSKRARQEISFA